MAEEEGVEQSVERETIEVCPLGGGFGCESAFGVAGVAGRESDGEDGKEGSEFHFGFVVRMVWEREAE